MAIRVKVNAKNQIILPALMRMQLHIKSGDYLFVEVQEDMVVLTAEPRSHSERLRGLHHEVWDDIDPTDYVRQERDAWNDHL